MYSVRRRMMLVLVAGFAVLILGGGAYVSDLLGDQATDEFDTALLAKASALVALTELEAGSIELDYSADPDFERDDKPDYFQYWLDNGKVISEIYPICDYLEDLHPTPPLVGTTPEEKAETRMWVHPQECPYPPEQTMRGDIVG